MIFIKNKSKFLLIIFFILILLQGLTGCKKEQLLEWGQEFGYNPDEIFPIKVGRNGYPYIEGYINKEKILFLIDTGNVIGTMISSRIAEKLNLKTIGKWQFKDSSGKAGEEYDIYQANNFKIFDTSFSDKKIYMMRHDNMEGILGLECFLDKSRITLDYKRGILGITKKAQVQII